MYRLDCCLMTFYEIAVKKLLIFCYKMLCDLVFATHLKITWHPASSLGSFGIATGQNSELSSELRRQDRVRRIFRAVFLVSSFIWYHNAGSMSSYICPNSQKGEHQERTRRYTEDFGWLGWVPGGLAIVRNETLWGGLLVMGKSAHVCGWAVEGHRKSIEHLCAFLSVLLWT